MSTFVDLKCNINFSPFSPFAAISLCGVTGSFHHSLSVAHSSLMVQAFRSLLIVSVHLNVGLPLGRLPSIFISTTARMFSVSSLLMTCPNHSRLLLTITIAIGSNFASSKISSFLRVFYQAHPHCPSHHYYICCFHTLLIFN